MKNIYFIALLLCGHLFAQEQLKEIVPFLDKHCVACHGPDKEKGGVRFDILEDMDEGLWTDIHEQLESEEMPPEEKPQPTAAERAAVVKSIYSLLTDETVVLSSGFRRMNKREYRNTVRDLLGMNKGLFDPALYLFDDEVDEGFDTNGSSLVMSDELLLEYMKSAKISLDAALYIPSKEKPQAAETTYSLQNMRGGNRRFTTYRKDAAVVRIGKAMIFGGESQSQVPLSGKYRVKVTACGVSRDNYPVKFPPAKGPVKLQVGVNSRGTGRIFSQSNRIATFDLLDDKPKSFQVEMWLNKGDVPYFMFENGAGKPAVLTRAGLRRGQLTKEDANQGNGYIGPGIKFSHVSVEGPLDVEWPPAPYLTTFGVKEIPNLESSQARYKILEQFMWRAYRRPLDPGEVAPYKEYMETRFEESGDWQDAMLNTFTAVMSSLNFLYIYEGKGELNSFELVNRLSYFLWSSMPDLELFRLAMTDDIQKDDVYIAQVKRMLASPKAEMFKMSFVNQWLSLDKLGEMRPSQDDKKFNAYYKLNLEESFRKETEMFFKYIVDENRKVSEFLDSDYTFVNRNLADLYKIPFKGEGKKMSYVKLPMSSPRGGLLGQGSIHSLTSNGVETLPVDRGHWVLDELLGSPPPPPPAEVPALVPDLNGVTTVREQLVKHREDPACMKCHVMMDPPGLAMEAYDVIGRYRTHYPNGKKIDAAGKFLGVGFKDMDDLKSILVDHEQFFAKSIIIKLAEYAKGRTLNVKDMEVVEEVLKQSAKDQFRFQNILANVLMSDLMSHR